MELPVKLAFAAICLRTQTQVQGLLCTRKNSDLVSMIGGSIFPPVLFSVVSYMPPPLKQSIRPALAIRGHLSTLSSVFRSSL